MITAHAASRTPFIQCALYLTLVCAIGAGLAIAPNGLAQTEPPAHLAQATDPPPPPPPPTDPPPPPPPTDPPPPPPTDPPPTAVPTAPPTEPPPATEQPTVEPPPTDVPATSAPPPTAPPQQQAPPPVQPTRPPATQTPDDADLDCELVEESAAPTSGSAEWSLYDCMLELDFGQVASVDIRGMTETPGWRVILVDFDAPDTPGLLDASNNRLGIDNLENAAAARFMLGVRLSCTAFTATELGFEITGDPTGSAASVEAIVTLPIAAEPAPIPDLTLESFAIAENGSASEGVIAVRYENAPTACGWQLLITIGGADTFPSDALAIVSVDGPDGATASLANGAISILIPASDAEPGSVGGAHVAISIGDGTTFESESILVEAFTSP